MKHFIEKDGWKVTLKNGGPDWEEINPTFTTPCKICGGYGKLRTPCDCFGPCSHEERCYNCGGKGTVKDLSKHPKPDAMILVKVSDALRAVMKEYGDRLNDGSLEEEIAKEKALNDSMKGASL